MIKNVYKYQIIIIVYNKLKDHNWIQYIRWSQLIWYNRTYIQYIIWSWLNILYDTTQIEIYVYIYILQWALLNNVSYDHNCINISYDTFGLSHATHHMIIIRQEYIRRRRWNIISTYNHWI